MKNLVLALSISLMGQFAAAQNVVTVAEGVKALETIVNTTSKTTEALSAIKNLEETLGMSVVQLKNLSKAKQNKLLGSLDAAALSNIAYYGKSLETSVSSVKGAEGANNLVEASVNAKNAGSSAIKLDAGFVAGKTATSNAAELSTIKNAKAISELTNSEVRAIKTAEAVDEFTIAKELADRNAVQLFKEGLEGDCAIGSNSVEIAGTKAAITKGVKKDILANKNIKTADQVLEVYVQNHMKELPVTREETLKSVEKLSKECDVISKSVGAAAATKLL